MIRSIGLISLLSLSGCVVTGWRSDAGVAYFGQAARTSIGASEVPGPKRGDACSYNILALVSFGDASISKAKENGGISRVATLDHDYSNMLWSMGRYCVVITGE
jgi:hypothetical protein